METAINKTPYLIRPLTYRKYKEMVEKLVQQNRTTGQEQTEERVAFTRLNLQRMKRVEKQFALHPELNDTLQGLKEEWHWLVLCESWCGDGAQLVPALAAVADASPSISLTVLLRDENPELMDTCLTNGGRAIPKLICLDAATQERVFTWGPRPAAIKQQLDNFKQENPLASHDEMVHQLHTWYAKDKSLSLQQDLLQLIREARLKESVLLNNKENLV